MGTKGFIESVRGRNHRDPIAIVGMGCRFPGGVHGPESFWQLLREGVDAIREIPSDRMDIGAYYDPRPALPGKITTRWGGFLDQIDKFDAAFFGISPREAERLDPQQRLLLEVAWEAFEDGGQRIDKTDLQTAGVFIGLWLNDYEARLFKDPRTVDFHMTTGTGRYSASGRLSYFFGFQGPSLTVDTACSSSLVAVHLACRSLWSGECSIALAGGANVILQPHISIAYSQSKMIAPDGRCKFGDASANGYVRSEGAGIVVLKPLSEAIKNGDPIYALIQGSAVNNDGSSSGHLTTPARHGQEELLRSAYRDAGISPGQVQYVEAHGTGTIAGDPVEVSALGNVLKTERKAGSVCYLGSVKTNFGHTEGAAGVAGLIKTALVLKHRMIPASLHFSNPNPTISWKEYPVQIPRASVKWPQGSGIAVAGVNSFGIAGTNAHVVLTEAPANQPRTGASQNADVPCLLPISARSPEALVSLARKYGSLLEDTQGPLLTDVVFTAAERRPHHDYRLAAIADSRRGMSELLAAFARGENVPGTSKGTAGPDQPLKIVFVCPGQGSQWVGMGRQLLRKSLVFRETLNQCDQAMRPFADWSLTEQLNLDPNDPGYRLGEIDVIQPVLASIEIALAAQWQSWGVRPDAIVGHSMGEVAAAYVAGALKLEDAMRIICLRSRLLYTVRGKGAMALVALPLKEAENTIARFKDCVSAAVSNSPRSTVVSGDPSAIESILQELQQRNIFCRPVKVDVASHSPQMDPLADELRRLLEALEPTNEQIPIYSTVTGGRIQGTDLDKDYWARNLRYPVLFSNVVQQLAGEKHTVFIELSPHPILLPSIEETLHHAGVQGHAIASLERDKNEQMAMLSSVGRLYTTGFSVDWSRIFPSGGKVVTLPSYPWQYQRFWIDEQPQAGLASGSQNKFLDGSQEHPVLGLRLPSIAALAGTSIWQTTVAGPLQEFLRGYQRDTSVPIPEAAYVELASVAANEVFGQIPIQVSGLTVHKPMVVSAASGDKIQLALTRTGAMRASFQISSCACGTADEWELRISGQVSGVDAPLKWLYQLEWQPKPLPQASLTSDNRSGRWLIFADCEGVGSALAKVIQSHGDDALLVFAGDSYQVQSANRFTVSPNNPNDIQQLLRNVLKPQDVCCGIIYLWGLDSTDSMESSLVFNYDAVLRLIQSLAQTKDVTKPRIWFVTRGAQAVGSVDRRTYSVQQSPLWGLGRVIALEYPDLMGGLVDLPADGDHGTASTNVAQRLYEQLFSADGEDQIALREESRYVLRLAKARSGALKKQKLVIHPDATYLITGGLGGLGLRLAKWLIEQGARHLVLTGRTGLPERQMWNSIPENTEMGRRVAAVQELEKTGAEVLERKADVANESEMAELWQRLRERPQPIRGIIHAAGIAKPQSLLEMTPAEAHKTLRPKIQGAWLLHKITQSQRDSGSPLDFFILFSSASSIFGAKDLAPYAAANHFLDALSHYRAALGLPCLCINWGWWDNPGLVSEDMADIFRNAGLEPMPSQQALAILTHLLETGAGQTMVANIDWSVFRPILESRKARPLLEDMPARSQMDNKREMASDPGLYSLLRQIQEASGNAKKQILQDAIRAQVAEILGFKAPEAVNLHQGFFKMGMDSVMTVQLRNYLETRINCSLPPTVAFEYPTVVSLTDFVAGQVMKFDDSSNAPVDLPGQEESEPAPVIEPAELSENELVDLLAKKLEQIH